MLCCVIFQFRVSTYFRRNANVAWTSSCRLFAFSLSLLCFRIPARVILTIPWSIRSFAAQDYIVRAIWLMQAGLCILVYVIGKPSRWTDLALQAIMSTTEISWNHFGAEDWLCAENWPTWKHTSRTERGWRSTKSEEELRILYQPKWNSRLER